MKRILIVLFCGLSAFTDALAQEDEASKAFQHLSVGVEFLSTTGFGIELAAPINSHLAVRGGITMLPLSFNSPIEVTIADAIISKMDVAMQDPAVASELASRKLPNNPRNICNEVDGRASLGLINGKLLVDFYPSKKGSFHLTGGLFIGPGNLVKIEGKMQEAYDVLQVMDKHGHKFFNDEFIKNSKIAGKDLMNIDGSLGINSVKPYLGIGFGRAVPNRRVSFSTELGAFYQGSPTLGSDNANIQRLIDDNLGDIAGLLKKLSIYPVFSLKLYVKLF